MVSSALVWMLLGIYGAQTSVNSNRWTVSLRVIKLETEANLAFIISTRPEHDHGPLSVQPCLARPCQWPSSVSDQPSQQHTSFKGNVQQLCQPWRLIQRNFTLLCMQGERSFMGRGKQEKVWISEREGRQFVSSFDGAAFYCSDTGLKIHWLLKLKVLLFRNWLR